jgi:hypothetical protein
VKQSPEACAAVALGRRSLASSKARGKLAFSDEEKEGEGESEKELPLPHFRKPAATVAAAHRSHTEWPSDLAGAVTSSNTFHWNPPMGSRQHGHGSPFRPWL